MVNCELSIVNSVFGNTNGTKIKVLPPQPFRKLSECVTGIPIAIGTAFDSLKKFASHFFNPACGGTEPKEAPNPITGGSGRLNVQE